MVLFKIMAVKTKTRNLIRLKCSVCDKVNYYLWKKKDSDFKLNIKKFCRFCRKHTNHKESRK